MEVLVGIQAFAEHLSIQHVMVLNLIGWMIKGIFRHRGWGDWTDIIPVILGVAGVTLAFLDPIKYEGSFIVYGLANAGLAWLLHQIFKGGVAVAKTFGKK